jgi:hypothetical protein
MSFLAVRRARPKDSGGSAQEVVVEEDVEVDVCAFDVPAPEPPAETEDDVEVEVCALDAPGPDWPVPESPAETDDVVEVDVCAVDVPEFDGLVLEPPEVSAEHGVLDPLESEPLEFADGDGVVELDEVPV